MKWLSRAHIIAPSSSLDGLFSWGLVKSYDMQQFEAIMTGGPKDARVRTTNATLILLEMSQTKLSSTTFMSSRDTSYLTQFPETVAGPFLL
jgi:hypothetical protein